MFRLASSLRLKLRSSKFVEPTDTSIWSTTSILTCIIVGSYSYTSAPACSSGPHSFLDA